MKLDLIDVFGAGPLRGNPLAVVHGAEALSDAQMLSLTQWLGFSETAFLLPPSDPAADYRVRIFYPAGELRFAGHPTLGSCHAWLEAGGNPRGEGRIVQQCGAGLVSIRQSNSLLAFEAPEMVKQGPLSPAERAEAIRIAGIREDRVVEAFHADNGPQWQVLRLATLDDLLAARPLPSAPAGTDIGLVAPHPAGSERDWEVRAFFTDQHGQIKEDPVTGSLNAGIAIHLFARGLVQGHYLAGQGQQIGADGWIDCTCEADGSVWIGGRTATIARGGGLPLLA